MFPRFVHSRSSLLPVSLAAVLGLCGCGGSTPVATTAATPSPAPTPPPAPTVDPLSKVVVLGDSLAAGFQNGSLLDSQQQNGWAALVAAQAGFSLTLPLIAAPGLPPVLQLVEASLPPQITTASGTSTGRENQDQQATDLAVPGFKLADLLNVTPVAQPTTDDQLAASVVLGYPQGNTGSAIAQAIALKPTTIYLWAGNNDALAADAAGDPLAMTPVATFTSSLSQVLSTLQAGTGAHLIVANIPDVTEIPYLTSATEVLSIIEQETGLPAATAGDLLGIGAGDFVNVNGLLALDADAAALANFQVPAPLPAADVLTAAEVAQVQATITSYNQAIAQQVSAAGGTLVDLHSYIDGLAANGITINGYHASALYLGGLFSLDAIHPTNTGYALLANQFITATNTALGKSIPLVDPAAVAAKDPLFGPNRPGSTLPYGIAPLPGALVQTRALEPLGMPRPKP